MPRWLSWLLNLFASFFRRPKPSDSGAPALTSESTPKPRIHQIHYEPPKPELDDHAVIQFVNESGPIVSHACGHEDHAYFDMLTFGELLKMPTDKGPAPWCRKCAMKEANYRARCSKCGSAILVGQGIAFYDQAPPDRRWQASYIVINDRHQYIGCLGKGCCPYPPAFYAGHLTKQGVWLAYENASTSAQRVFETKGFTHAVFK